MAGRLSTVLQGVGYAVWQLQEVETTVAAYVVIRLRESHGVGEARGRAIAAEEEGRTFGQLLRELTDAGIFSVEYAVRLRTLLADRNWLVHRSRREHRGVLTDDTHLRALIERLEDIAARALALHVELGMDLERYVRSAGVTREYIDQEAERIRSSWETPS